MPSGIISVNFGAFPGTATAEVAVTGQAAILAGSLVEAWVFPPGGTADHSEDEHIIEFIKVTVGKIVAATGFTIFCEAIDVDTQGQPSGPRLHGLWQMGWAWR